MSWFLRGVIVLVVFVCAVIATLPLSFALRFVSPAPSLGWDQAQGTVWSGQLTGLRYGRQPIGTARVSLLPSRLLRGQFAYDLSLVGPVGRGRGQIILSGNNRIAFEDVGIRVNIASLVGLADRVRQLGGTADLSAQSIVLDRFQCVTARGAVSTDVITRAGDAYGRNWPMASGQLSCDRDMLLIPLDASTPAGETIEVRTRIGVSEVSSVHARIWGVDQEIETALALVGFQTVDGVHEYRRETQLMEAM